MTENINKNTENIGARRLHTLLEKLLEDISFEGSELEDKNQILDSDYVRGRLDNLVKDPNLRQYIL
jgi:ATP-dependent HslUV protease ATP-binding subunit HslU